MFKRWRLSKITRECWPSHTHLVSIPKNTETVQNQWSIIRRAWSTLTSISPNYWTFARSCERFSKFLHGLQWSPYFGFRRIGLCILKLYRNWWDQKAHSSILDCGYLLEKTLLIYFSKHLCFKVWRGMKIYLSSRILPGLLRSLVESYYPTPSSIFITNSLWLYCKHAKPAPALHS